MSDNEILSLSYEKPAAFGELFDRHQTRFMRMAKASLVSKDAAEEVVQNTFVRIYKYGRKFLADGGDFKNWSNKILQNCIKDEFARRRDLVQLSEEVKAVLESPSEYPEYESNNFVQSVFQNIDAVSAEILQMRFVARKSFKQIGKLLGISSGAARVRAYRAKKCFGEAYNQIT